MKKYIGILLLFAIASSLSAQKITFGIKGGYEAALSYNDLLNTNLVTSSTNEVKTGFSSGYQAGIWLRFGGKAVYLQPEAVVNVKNINQTLNVDGFSCRATYKTQTLEIPLLVGYRFLNLGTVSFHINGGPKAIFNAGSSANLDQYAKNVDFNTAAWALDGGLGVDIMSFSLDLRYTQYLTNSSTITLQNNQLVSTKNNKQGIFLSLAWKIL
jgi:hypothetical protein